MATVAESPLTRTEQQLGKVEHTTETLNRWVTWMNNPEIRKWMDTNFPSNPEDINIWLFNATHDPRRHYFSINHDGREVGFISLRQDAAPTTTGEIGIVIGETDYQGTGLGTNALRSVLAYAQNDLNLTSVRAMIKPDNEKSIRLFTRAGFTKTDDVTVNGDPMGRYEKYFINAENRVQHEARALFTEIGLTRPTGKELGKAAVEFARQLQAGGNNKDPSVSIQMTDSLYPSHDRETMKAIAGKKAFIVQFGGSSIRVAVGEIGPDGLPRVSTDPASESPRLLTTRRSKKLFASPDDLFAEAFRLIDSSPTTVLPTRLPETISVVWSYEGNPIKVADSVDILSADDMHKGLRVTGLADHPVGKSFVEAFRNRYYPKDIHSPMPHVAAINDTTAVVFSQIPQLAQENQIGIFDGNGFNVAIKVGGTTYNLECGHFTGLPLPPYADAMDAFTDDPGKFTAEKQISGKYVGEQFNAIIDLMINRGVIHATKTGTLGARDLDDFLRGEGYNIVTKLGGLLSNDELGAIAQAALLLRDRAALYIGTLVGTVVRVYGDGFPETVDVPAGGQFFLRTPGLKDIASSIATATAGRPVRFLTDEHLPILGGIVAATSS